MRSTFITLALVLCLSGTSTAAYTNYGGSLNCGKVVSSTGAGKLQDIAYVSGFITGVNYSIGRTTNGSGDGFYQWVRNYCEKNPLDTILDAVEALSSELDKRANEQIK